MGWIGWETKVDRPKHWHDRPSCHVADHSVATMMMHWVKRRTRNVSVAPCVVMHPGKEPGSQRKTIAMHSRVSPAMVMWQATVGTTPSVGRLVIQQWLSRPVTVPVKGCVRWGVARFHLVAVSGRHALLLHLVSSSGQELVDRAAPAPFAFALPGACWVRCCVGRRSACTGQL